MHARTVHGEELERETTLVEGQPDRRTPGTTSEEETGDELSSSDGEAQEEEEDRPNGPNHPRGSAGYAHLSEFMTKTEHSMIRRYKELSLMNLLYLQAEIHHLKAELDVETAADALDRESCERRYWDFHWASLSTSGDRGEGRRWEIWSKLREKLYEYCALQVLSLPPHLFLFLFFFFCVCVLLSLLPLLLRSFILVLAFPDRCEQKTTQ